MAKLGGELLCITQDVEGVEEWGRRSGGGDPKLDMRVLEKEK